MKILHIPQRRIGLKNYIGGIKSVLLEEIKWENKIKGIESKILVYDRLEEKNSFFINNKSLKEDILDYNPDFIIFDGFWAIQHCFIARFLRKKNIKYYIKPHGAFNKIAQKNSKIKFLKKLIARILIFNNYVKNSNGLIFLNEMEKENSIYRKKNEFILPNGIEELNIELIDNPKKDKDINFIFLGRIDIFHKGIDILLKTILENKKYFIKNKVVFNFYGSGREDDMYLFNNYLKQIPEVIQYHGSIYGQDKYKELQRNDIFILTSRFEGMPMGILEALSFGVPCFVSKETGMGEYIEKYNAGWVIKSREELFNNLKECIKEFEKNSEYLKNNSLECVTELYWGNIIKTYEKVYFLLKNS